MRTLARRRRANTGGFTILELIIAATISLIIFGIGFYTITASQRVQAETTRSLRQSENARLFFDMIERDLQGAYPAWFIDEKMDLVLPETPTVKTDALQFLARLDNARRAPDAIFLVRYYVVEKDSTGRFVNQLRRRIDADYVRTGFTFTGVEPNAELTAVPMIDDFDSTVFDGVRSVSFSFTRYDSVSKTYTPPVDQVAILHPNPANLSDPRNDEVRRATHLLVRLFMNDDGRGNQKDLGVVMPRMYQKAIPLPAGYSK